MYSFPNLEPVVVPCLVLTVASWPAYRFLRRQVSWSGIPISKNSTVCGTSLAVKWLRLCASNARDAGSIPGSRSSPGGGNGNPLQYSCLENPMDRGTWWAAIHGVTKSWTWLSDWTHTQKHTHTYKHMYNWLTAIYLKLTHCCQSITIQ